MCLHLLLPRDEAAKHHVLLLYIVVIVGLSSYAGLACDGQNLGVETTTGMLTHTRSLGLRYKTYQSLHHSVRRLEHSNNKQVHTKKKWSLLARTRSVDGGAIGHCSCVVCTTRQPYCCSTCGERLPHGDAPCECVSLPTHAPITAVSTLLLNSSFGMLRGDFN